MIIRFSSNKLKRLVDFKKNIDKFNKGVIFDFFQYFKSKKVDMNQPLSYHKLNIRNKKKTSIPFCLYKTGEDEEKDLPLAIKELFKKTIADNPGLKIQYYSNTDRIKFINKHFDKDVVQAYNSLNPGAYRADLFRLCILYINGGIYGDLTQTYLVPIKNIVNLEKDTLVLVRDYINENQTTNGIYQSFLIAEKGNLFLKKAIEQIVLNVKNKYYGINSLDPTGPYLCRRVFQNYSGAYKLELELNPFDYKSIRNIRTGERVIITKLPNHDQLINKNKQTDYHQMWLNKNIYTKDMKK